MNEYHFSKIHTNRNNIEHRDYQTINTQLRLLWIVCQWRFESFRLVSSALRAKNVSKSVKSQQYDQIFACFDWSATDRASSKSEKIQIADGLRDFEHRMPSTSD